MICRHGTALRKAMGERELVSFIGVYDVFSALITAKHFDAVFVSGYSFAASQYGVPDAGYNTWGDIAAFTGRVREALPEQHILVDVDDGFGDPAVAAHAMTVIESVGASAVVIEDQARPRKCGHLDHKLLVGVDDFIEKLRAIVDVRKDMLIIARTDAVNSDEVTERLEAYSEVGVDGVLAEAATELDLLSRLASRLPVPVMCNQIAGGKTPKWSTDELVGAGISLVNYSTPCLFAAHAGIDEGLRELKGGTGSLADLDGISTDLSACNELLEEGLKRSLH